MLSRPIIGNPMSAVTLANHGFILGHLGEFFRSGIRMGYPAAPIRRDDPVSDTAHRRRDPSQPFAHVPIMLRSGAEPTQSSFRSSFA